MHAASESKFKMVAVDGSRTFACGSGFDHEVAFVDPRCNNLPNFNIFILANF